MLVRGLRVILAAATIAGLVAAPASARRAPDWPGSGTPGVSVGGAVSSPATFSVAQLAAMPQQTFAVTLGSLAVTGQGVSLENLVNGAAPQLPDAKNALLRVTVAVSGSWGPPVTFALGELDPAFGNHPAYLATSVAGHPLPAPVLVVPGDTLPLRDRPAVDTVTVGVQSPSPTTPPAPGSLTVDDRGNTVVLSAAQLAALPQQTLQVSFGAGTGPQSHTEVGPTLRAVLRAAHVRAGSDSWVAAVGDDGYVATVTPAEARVGGKQLLVSLAEDGQPLAQPRLVVDGDVKGGRYVSGVDDLVVGSGL